jgi:hypothetical protein
VSFNFVDLTSLSNSFFIVSTKGFFEFNSRILFCFGTVCHIAFIIFSSCGSIPFLGVFNAQSAVQSLSFKTTSSIFSSQIVFLIKSKSDL